MKLKEKIKLFPWTKTVQDKLQESFRGDKDKLLKEALQFLIQSAKLEMELVIKENNFERAEKLLSVLKDYILHLHLQNILSISVEKSMKTLFILILSCSLDLGIFLSRGDAESGFLASAVQDIVVYLKENVLYIWDVLLRCDLLKKANSGVCHPVLKCLLKKPWSQAVSSCEYMKFILLLRLWKVFSPEKDEKYDIIDLAVKMNVTGKVRQYIASIYLAETLEIDDDPSKTELATYFICRKISPEFFKELKRVLCEDISDVDSLTGKEENNSPTEVDNSDEAEDMMEGVVMLNEFKPPAPLKDKSNESIDDLFYFHTSAVESDAQSPETKTLKTRGRKRKGDPSPEDSEKSSKGGKKQKQQPDDEQAVEDAGKSSGVTADSKKSKRQARKKRAIEKVASLNAEVQVEQALVVTEAKNKRRKKNKRKNSVTADEDDVVEEATDNGAEIQEETETVTGTKKKRRGGEKNKKSKTDDLLVNDVAVDEVANNGAEIQEPTETVTEIKKKKLSLRKRSLLQSSENVGDKDGSAENDVVEEVMENDIEFQQKHTEVNTKAEDRDEAEGKDALQSLQNTDSEDATDVAIAECEGNESEASTVTLQKVVVSPAKSSNSQSSEILEEIVQEMCENESDDGFCGETGAVQSPSRKTEKVDSNTLDNDAVDVADEEARDARVTSVPCIINISGTSCDKRLSYQSKNETDEEHSNSSTDMGNVESIIRTETPADNSLCLPGAESNSSENDIQVIETSATSDHVEIGSSSNISEINSLKIKDDIEQCESNNSFKSPRKSLNSVCSSSPSKLSPGVKTNLTSQLDSSLQANLVPTESPPNSSEDDITELSEEDTSGVEEVDHVDGVPKASVAISSRKSGNSSSLQASPRPSNEESTVQYNVDNSTVKESYKSPKKVDIIGAIRSPKKNLKKPDVGEVGSKISPKKEKESPQRQSPRKNKNIASPSKSSMTPEKASSAVPEEKDSIEESDFTAKLLKGTPEKMPASSHNTSDLAATAESSIPDPENSSNNEQSRVTDSTELPVGATLRKSFGKGCPSDISSNNRDSIESSGSSLSIISMKTADTFDATVVNSGNGVSKVEPSIASDNENSELNDAVSGSIDIKKEEAGIAETSHASPKVNEMIPTNVNVSETRRNSVGLQETENNISCCSKTKIEGVGEKSLQIRLHKVSVSKKNLKGSVNNVAESPLKQSPRKARNSTPLNNSSLSVREETDTPIQNGNRKEELDPLPKSVRSNPTLLKSSSKRTPVKRQNLSAVKSSTSPLAIAGSSGLQSKRASVKRNLTSSAQSAVLTRSSRKCKQTDSDVEILQNDPPKRSTRVKKKLLATSTAKQLRNGIKASEEASTDSSDSDQGINSYLPSDCSSDASQPRTSRRKTKGRQSPSVDNVTKVEKSCDEMLPERVRESRTAPSNSCSPVEKKIEHTIFPLRVKKRTIRLRHPLSTTEEDSEPEDKKDVKPQIYTSLSRDKESDSSEKDKKTPASRRGRGNESDSSEKGKKTPAKSRGRGNESDSSEKEMKTPATSRGYNLRKRGALKPIPESES